MQVLKIVIIIADNNDLIDILIMDILCPNRITIQYSIIRYNITGTDTLMCRPFTTPTKRILLVVRFE